jgi:hypothetical protein
MTCPNPLLVATLPTLSDEALLDQLQIAALDYFLRSANLDNGLVADTSREGSPASIAVVGFALAAYAVAVSRGWMKRADAVQRSVAALRFFRDSDQTGAADATGYKGFYYHFLDMHSGKRVWQSELSMVDTTLLIAGALTACEYFVGDTSDEIELRELAELLYRRVDWCWSQDDAPTIRQGWKPECGFLHYGWEGYSEAILLYTLALASPTHAIRGDCYAAWTATYQWENLYDYDYLYAGPLFIHHFSHAWIDFRGIRDDFMREKRSDYFENSRRAAYIHREYAQRNPNDFVGYNEHCWGLSAGDGPSSDLGADASGRRLFGYAARGVPYGPDDGTLAVPAMLSSLPFAPDIVMDGLRYVLMRYPEVLVDGRLASGLNPSLIQAEGESWVSSGHYGLDQGIVLMMIENHRTGRIWEWMRGCPYFRTGLRQAGFRGGWLRRRARGETH